MVCQIKIPIVDYLKIVRAVQQHIIQESESVNNYIYMYIAIAVFTAYAKCDVY